jgi:penicillin-binding protein 1C
LALCLKALVFFIVFCAVFWLALGFFPDPLEEGQRWDWTTRVTDRNGRVLREFLSPSAARRDFVPLKRISPYLREAALAAEDKRFFWHPGFDPLAALRAAKLNLERGAIVSGGSTITMQLARLSLGLSPGPRTFRRKLKETWLALLIERRHSKDEILEAWLNIVPAGRLTSGFEAASRLYLGKSAQVLSPAEAAFLAALPRSPGSLDPYRYPERIAKRRSVILQRLRDRGVITEEARARAELEPLSLNTAPPPWLAPHFVSYVARSLPERPPEAVRTTLDSGLQEGLERLARAAVADYGAQGLEQVSVIVLSLPEMEVLAWVGSGDFWNSRDGQLDGVLAPRQPGSALKPFIYAQAFDSGRAWPSLLLSDAPKGFASENEVFSPKNYSGEFSPPVSARVALASSLNLPAVNLAGELGVRAVLENLRSLGLESLTQEHGYYGLGIALGDGEVSLHSLAAAYGALARGGVLSQPVFILPEVGAAGGAGAKAAAGKAGDGAKAAAGGEGGQAGNGAGAGTGSGKRAASGAGAAPARRVLSEEAAFLITDILGDPRARARGFGRSGVLDTPYPSAVKTGTSSNFRDNWCIGYTDKYVVGVWAGNFDARPMTRISGVTGAGQLWRRAMDILAERSPPQRPEPPPGVISVPICPVSGLPAGPDCPGAAWEWFLAKFPLPPQCEHSDMRSFPVLGEERAFRLISPMAREIYAWDPGLPPERQQLRALAQSVPEVSEIVWYLNGEELARARTEGYSRASLALPLERGAHLLEVVGLRDNGEPLRDQARYSVR